MVIFVFEFLFDGKESVMLVAHSVSHLNLSVHFVNSLNRIYKINELLAHGTHRSREELMNALGVSRATLKRDLAYMRDMLNAPIKWDASQRGYYLDNSQEVVGPSYQLPGLWLNQQELLALATLQQLLQSMDSDGVLAQQLKPFMDQVNLRLGHDQREAAELAKRVSVISTTSRRNNQSHIQMIGTALVKRKQLHLVYRARASAMEVSERDISPQRLIHYRTNWYVGAWCHKSDDIRTFSLDAIESCVELEETAISMPEEELAEYYDKSYGIFGGKSRQWAVLRFNAEAARYVEEEVWHQDQRNRWCESGTSSFYELEVPYTNPEELIMDVLRHGASVEVAGPEALRKRFKERVCDLAMLYSE